MAKRFEGRSIVVTGGASGIGRATALAFASEGGLVTIADLDSDGAAAAIAEIEGAGGVARYVPTDAVDEAAVIRLIEAASAAHGPVRHAFNNVGLSRGIGLTELSREDWDWTLAVSITSTFLAMKHEVPAMLAHGGGTIVNTASMSGRIYTEAANAAYSAAKAGVVHLSHYAACAYGAQGVRVNSVSPGLTATPIVARMLSVEQQNAIAAEHQTIARAVDPAEIAATVLFLSSDEAAMITGRDIEVSGGRR